MKINYDNIADVLYIAIKDRPAIATEVIDGIFVRTNKDEVMGVTILDFKERFMDFKKRFTGPPDTGNLPPCDVPGRACEECEFKPCPLE